MPVLFSHASYFRQIEMKYLWTMFLSFLNVCFCSVFSISRLIANGERIFTMNDFTSRYLHVHQRTLSQAKRIFLHSDRWMIAYRGYITHTDSQNSHKPTSNCNNKQWKQATIINRLNSCWHHYRVFKSSKNTNKDKQTHSFHFSKEHLIN